MSHAKVSYRCVTKLQTTRPKTGDSDELKAIIESACRIEKAIQAKSGMVVVQDTPNPLYWETAYFKLTTADDDAVATPPLDAPAKPTDGPLSDKPRSIIDLTASDDEIASMQRVQIKPETIVKQEIVDDDIIVKAGDKGKAVVRPVKDGATGGGGRVATKSYRHGDAGGAAKMMRTETLLTSIADGLSAEAQEKREVSRMGLLREAMDRERGDQVADERMQDMKLEIQTLKKEIEDLRRENTLQRDRATEAVTMLNILNGASRPFMPFRDPPVTYMPGIPAFAPNPSHYSVVPTDNQSPDPEGIAGPSHTVHADDLEISEDK